MKDEFLPLRLEEMSIDTDVAIVYSAANTLFQSCTANTRPEVFWINNHYF